LRSGIPEHPETTLRPPTLGAVLYVGHKGPLVLETQWRTWLRAIAARDPRALRDLFETAQDVVCTFISRIVDDRNTAESLTIEVFFDVWRYAATFDPTRGSVLGWIMSNARYKAMHHVELCHHDTQGSETRAVITDAFAHAAGALAETERTTER
jgi:DNA-directed RNA polymerase specialized sigma24 family protein